LAISTSPLYAQGQQPDTAKLKADARNVVVIIRADRAKNQTCCKMMALSWQMNEAALEKQKKSQNTITGDSSITKTTARIRCAE
jgi:hypothetical protein